MREWVDKLPEEMPRPLKIDGWHSFRTIELPPRRHVLAPIIPVKGLAMLYAWRGVGKTYVGLGMAHAIAAGIDFLRWHVNEPRRVLYVDGEMPAEEMQARIERLVAASPGYEPDDQSLRILSLDRQEVGVNVNLANEADQDHIQEALGDGEVLMLDNRSTLVYGGRENDAESWDKMQQWLLRLRRAGKTVLLFDHAGRGGNSRGTSKREDVLDTVIHLKRPDDYQAEEGARFEVHLEKARGVYGADAAPFEARLETRDGADIWTIKTMEDINTAKVRELSGEGRTVREIAEETGIPRSTVSRIQKKLRDGLVPQNPSLESGTSGTSPKNGRNPTVPLSQIGGTNGFDSGTKSRQPKVVGDNDPFAGFKDPSLRLVR
jgi:hypothetical protein